MSARTQLEAYLGEFRKRLKSLIVARGAAVLAVTALVLTLAAVFIGTRQAFSDSVMISARVVILLALAGVVVGLLVFPLRKLKRTEGVADIERRAPDFDGRLETYRELTQRSDDESGPSVFLGLLAEDALRLARRIPVALKVRNWEISTPAVAAGLAVLALAWFAAFGPDNWRYGVRHLWAGWALSDTLPPQRVAVSPGDGAVRRGGDLFVEAQAEGFDPVEATVFAQFEGGEWESAVMDETGGEFEFRFFGIRQPLRYYVEAAGVRSAEYDIDVVDLPRVSNVRLTYHYPQWTRQETRTEDPGGDIEAVEGTEVEVEITTDQPLGDAALIVNGASVTMTTDGTTATAVLTVEEEGEYHIATSFNAAPVQLTDNYFIDVQADNRPVVKVIKPGRDWRASNIEEVLVRVEATDDFNLDRLELNYAVNGGEWQVASLEADGDYSLTEEVLFLEELTAERAPVVSSAAPNLFDIINADDLDLEVPQEEEDQEPQAGTLAPGDVVSYYVEAFDRDASSRTDLFFIEVQPFDRSFSQSMAGGGGGGGGGGGEQNEISQRQKEILVATWNLIREQDEQTGFQDEQQIEDNGALLAELQRTLAEQARTLASRTRARQLTSADEKIQTFVQALESAAEAMDPAAEQLAETEFDDAVPSEQAALQHLLRAESVFTDIQVAFNQGGGGGGGGGFAGRDLAELFELEMDLEKNQYETEAPVAMNNQSPEEQGVDEAIQKLQELARRQESLA
ncbi:MAG: hypothetical protein KJO76_01370, partial [Gammaproteobacteria bacterium]|nr:hypothetical protein [Gammaproteobacteria bacterium]